jgi:hypothetical protein
LIVIMDDRKVITRWNLETGTRELTVAEPGWAEVREMRMGMASDGPAILGMTDGATIWLNTASLTAFEPKTQGAPYGWGGALNLPFTFRLSADGSILVGWVENISPRTIITAIFHSDHTDFHAASVEGIVGFYYTLGADDSLIYTSGGINTLDMNPLAPDVFSHAQCIPAQDERFFLAVNGPSLALYTTADKRLLLTLPKLDEFHGDYWDVAKQIFFIPKAKLLVTIPPSRNEVIIRRFDLMAELNKAGIDYLFVSSVPPPIFHSGHEYVYQIDTQSKRGGLKYFLDSGPPGMTLSKTGRLTWSVPSDISETEEHPVVRVQDSSGQEIYHTFRIMAAHL